MSHATDPFGLYWEAVTHRSWAHENGGHNNERLEFLGDAVLQMTVTDELYLRFPSAQEGELHRRRKQVVNNQFLARYAATIDLGSALRLGRGELKSGGRQKERILACAMEALLGALYLDQGYGAVHTVIKTLMGSAPGQGPVLDPKNTLQHRTQVLVGDTPEYRTVAVDGPDHEPTYRVKVFIEGVEAGEGTGLSKRDAQQRAAEQALTTWEPK